MRKHLWKDKGGRHSSTFPTWEFKRHQCPLWTERFSALLPLPRRSVVNTWTGSQCWSCVPCKRCANDMQNGSRATWETKKETKQMSNCVPLNWNPGRGAGVGTGAGGGLLVSLGGYAKFISASALARALSVHDVHTHEQGCLLCVCLNMQSSALLDSTLSQLRPPPPQPSLKVHPHVSQGLIL